MITLPDVWAARARGCQAQPLTPRVQVNGVAMRRLGRPCGQPARRITVYTIDGEEHVSALCAHHHRESVLYGEQRYRWLRLPDHPVNDACWVASVQLEAHLERHELDPKERDLILTAQWRALRGAVELYHRSVGLHRAEDLELAGTS